MAIYNDPSFCTKCGSPLRSGSRFCERCGAPVRTIPAAERFSVRPVRTAESPARCERNSRPGIGDPALRGQYSRLGGFLAFIAYGQAAGAVLMGISLILTLAAFARYRQYFAYFGGAYSSLYGFAVFFAVAATALGMFVCLKLFNMIRNRDANCLRFYETLILVEGVLYFFLIAAGGNGRYVSGLIGMGIGFFVFTTYFRKSVRVRTYFGSDAYLKRSIFFKNCVPPDPA